MTSVYLPPQVLPYCPRGYSAGVFAASMAECRLPRNGVSLDCCCWEVALQDWRDAAAGWLDFGRLYEDRHAV